MNTLIMKTMYFQQLNVDGVMNQTAARNARWALMNIVVKTKSRIPPVTFFVKQTHVVRLFMDVSQEYFFAISASFIICH